MKHTGLQSGGHKFVVQQSCGSEQQFIQHAHNLIYVIQVNVRIRTGCLSLLPGAQELLEDGVRSTAATSNSYFLQYVDQGTTAEQDLNSSILLDPQTSGDFWQIRGHTMILCMAKPCVFVQVDSFSVSQMASALKS